jgi:hypothetical protein
MGVLKGVEPTGFLAFAPAFVGTNWADVNRRIIQNCPHGRGFVFTRLFGSGFAGLGLSRIVARRAARGQPRDLPRREPRHRGGGVRPRLPA